MGHFRLSNRAWTRILLQDSRVTRDRVRMQRTWSEARGAGKKTVLLEGKEAFILQRSMQISVNFCSFIHIICKFRSWQKSVSSSRRVAMFLDFLLDSKVCGLRESWFRKSVRTTEDAIVTCLFHILAARKFEWAFGLRERHARFSNPANDRNSSSMKQGD